MTETAAKIEEKRDDLEALAESDLPVANVAETLLEIADREPRG